MKRKIRDVDKVELLYSLYEQEMYRVCFGVLKDVHQAEDAVSESFIKIIGKRDRIEKVNCEEVRRFVIKTARNTAIDMYRKNARDRKYLAGLPEGDKEISLMDTEPAMDDLFSLDEHELLDTLNYKYRIVLECVCLEELTVRETAAVLKVSEACVRKRLERARNQLAAEIYGEDSKEIIRRIK